MAKPLEHQSFI